MAEDQRTLALGLQSFVWRLCGSIPGPILFGAIFDSTCLFWQRECGRRGNCWVYNNTALSSRAVVLALLAMAGYFTAIFLSWLFYPKKREGEGEGEGEEGGVEMREGVGSGGDESEPAVDKRHCEGEKEREREEEEGGGSRHNSLSVIGKMQCRNSTAELLEAGSNSSSSSSNTDL